MLILDSDILLIDCRYPRDARYGVNHRLVGQAALPDLNKDVAAESALTMDFKPKDKTEGELTFTIEAAGNYLLRLETVKTAVGDDGHEHFAALDIVVK